MGKNRIFLGVQEIAGMMERIDSAFHELGIESEFFCMDSYGFSSDDMEKKDQKILKKYRFHTNMILKEKEGIKRNYYCFLQLLDILHIFFYSITHFDEFIFIFGHGMFFYNKYLQKVEEIEFWMLKKCHKKMVMWLCGSDSRAPYCDIYGGDKTVERIYGATQKRNRRIKMLEKYMPLIDYPASSHFHKKPYIVYNCIGVPIDTKEKCILTKNKNKKIKIFHAPSNQKAKGTTEIRKVLKELENEGYQFEYVELSGVPHNEVLKIMAEADLVVDQLYADTPLAGFATEASLNGIPVIVGGYYAEYYDLVPQNPIVPTIFCNPEMLKEKIIELLCDEKLRKKIGKKEMDYVEKNNNSKVVAKKLLRVLDNNIPIDWMYDPAQNEYPFGFGLTREKVIQNVVDMIDTYGEEALMLDKGHRIYQVYMDIYRKAKE